MAVITPWAINAEVGAPAYNALNLRRILAALMAGGDTATSIRPGIVDAAALEVTLDGSTIEVTAGACLIDSAEGPYVTGLTADSIAADFVDAVNTLDPADVTDDRIDVVVMRVFDDDHDSSNIRAGFVEYLAGTAAPVPAPPAVPARSLLLATIDVPSSGGGSPVVTDERPLTWARQPPAPIAEVFTSSGTWSKPDGCKAVRVRVLGGGGAGGGAPTTGAGESSMGRGGAGGGYSEKWIDAADLLDTETVTVGAGGTAVSGGTGGNGGSSSFGAHCSATGGNGGTTSTSTATLAWGGNSGVGTGSGGDINLTGSPGGGGFTSNTPTSQARGGTGGAGAVLGAEREAADSSVTNGVAGRPGSGGSGGANNDSEAVTRSGGAGGAGRVIVETFF